MAWKRRSGAVVAVAGLAALLTTACGAQLPVGPSSFERPAQPTLRERLPEIAELFTWKHAFSSDDVPVEDPTIHIPGYDDPPPPPVPLQREPAATEPLEVFSFTPFERRFPPGGSTGNTRPPTPTLAPLPTTVPEVPPATAPAPTPPEPTALAEPPNPTSEPAPQP